jgi:hypothetical protein
MSDSTRPNVPDTEPTPHSDLEAFYQNACNVRHAVVMLDAIARISGAAEMGALGAVIESAKATLTDIFDHDNTPASLRKKWTDS